MSPSPPQKKRKKEQAHLEAHPFKVSEPLFVFYGGTLVEFLTKGPLLRRLANRCPKSGKALMDSKKTLDHTNKSVIFKSELKTGEIKIAKLCFVTWKTVEPEVQPVENNNIFTRHLLPAGQSRVQERGEG